MPPVLANVSGVATASWKYVPGSPRVLVYVYFDGPLPPMIGYWTLN